MGFCILHSMVFCVCRIGIRLYIVLKREGSLLSSLHIGVVSFFLVVFVASRMAGVLSIGVYNIIQHHRLSSFRDCPTGLRQVLVINQNMITITPYKDPAASPASLAGERRVHLEAAYLYAVCHGHHYSCGCQRPNPALC